MIVDCFTQVWESPQQLGPVGPRAGAGAPGRPNVEVKAGLAHHEAATAPLGATIVVGFQSRYLKAEIPNAAIAAYVRSHRDRLIGFAGIDPSDPKQAIAQMHTARNELNLPGVAIAPAAQDFHPSSSQAMLVYAEAAELGMPVIFHTGILLTARTKLEYAQPVLLDEVARELPQLKIIIAHLGQPWVSETMLLLAKHANVYAELSRVLDDPWQTYQALRSAQHHGVTDRILFGSGFPFSTPAQAIEQLYGVSQLAQGTSLPPVPREVLRSIVERDALGALGLTTAGPMAAPAAAAVALPDDETDDL